MRTLQAIRYPKTVVLSDQWHSAKMPRTAFPLSKSHSYSLGRTWEWGVWTLEGGGDRYRLLVGFERSKEQYRAWLGREFGSDQALLARLEYHPDHKGWHLHYKIGNVEDVARGVVKEHRAHDKSRDCKVAHVFDVSQYDALNIAFRVFNVSQANDFLGALL